MTASHPTLIVPDTSADSTNLLMKLVQDNVNVVYPKGFDAMTADGILLPGNNAARSGDIQLAALGFLDIVPDGLVLIDQNDIICWHNKLFQKLISRTESAVGQTFWSVLNLENEEATEQPFGKLAPDPDRIFKRIVHLNHRRHLDLRSSAFEIPVGKTTADGQAADSKTTRSFTTIAIRDVTDEIQEKQKRDALYRAGIELGDLSPLDLSDMSPADRSEILEEKIINSSKEFLNFDVIEIRTLHAATNELRPLLQSNMQPEAAARKLYAEAENNGVTGYVAATRCSKLLKDTSNDEHYLCGAVGARSSMTVPLVMHEEVLGTFNVESPPGHSGFNEKDLEFLEMFAGLVAVAMNQLNLLMVEKQTTAMNSFQQVRKEVAMPADFIVRNATFILDRYIGHDPDMTEKLKLIIDNVRGIRSTLCNADGVEGYEENFAPMPASKSRDSYPMLKGKRVLVVDEDKNLVQSAHDLLEPHGCTVESAGDGEESFFMANQHHYDAALIAIKLSDMDGYECFCGLQDRCAAMPIILMAGFGYDGGHCIVKSRQRGLKTALYKPFRQHQLLAEVEKACSPPPTHE